MSKLTCRYYKQILPELDDVVTVMVRSISNLGAYVHLLEYDGQEGMILMTELSRKRIRSINKLIRVGKIETVVVIRLDDDRGFLDFYQIMLIFPSAESHLKMLRKAKIDISALKL